MSVDQLMGSALAYNVSTEAAAALAARLQLRDGAMVGDPAVVAHLDEVLKLAGLTDLIADVTSQDALAVIGTIRTSLLQALDLVTAPERPPGWVYEDPALLIGQGQMSAVVPWCIDESLDLMPGLRDRLGQPGARLLDIGCGIAALASAACRQWPEVSVVGVDPWAPSMAIARQQVAAAGLDDRITLQEIPIQELTEVDSFAAAWVPGPFLPPEIIADTMAVTLRALEPGGWALFGLFAGPENPLANALLDLKTVRNGGHPLSESATVQHLESGGFTDIAVLPRPWRAPLILVVGRKPR